VLRVFVENLSPPLHACQRQRLCLDLVAPMLDRAAPALLIGEHGGGDSGSEGRKQHREHDRRAAR
jgi:hypothetical protein